jgi:hypothetical protein
MRLRRLWETSCQVNQKCGLKRDQEKTKDAWGIAQYQNYVTIGGNMSKPEITEEQIDPNTGERVSYCKTSPEHQQELFNVLKEHDIEMNKFVMMSQNMADSHIKWVDQRKKIGETDENFKKKMKWIAKDLGLAEHEPWTFNLQTKNYELRKPPEVEPLTPSQLEAKMNE